MTAKELAKRLDGREYCREVTETDRKDAKDSGLVIAYGASDDLLEFDGAISNEKYAYNGCTVFVRDGKVFSDNPDVCDGVICQYYKLYLAKAKSITAVWHDKGDPYWTIETEIPHASFRIIDYGIVFSVGIVFDIADTIRKTSNLNRNHWKKCPACPTFLSAWRYCPACGRPRSEAAWAELERRMGGSNGQID